MANPTELAKFVPGPPRRETVRIPQKMEESGRILQQYSEDDISHLLTPENFRNGVIPRLSPLDVPYLPDGARFVNIPDDERQRLAEVRSMDLIRWNLPDRFLRRLRDSKEPFKAPISGESRVMARFAADKLVVSFDNLRAESPMPANGRYSRSDIDTSRRNDTRQEVNIMGQARIPFALGSVPDVGSFLSYATMAQAGGMALISRDKVLSDPDQQAALTGDIIDFLRTVELPQELIPSNDQLLEFAQVVGIHEVRNKFRLREKYIEALRNSWIANVGAAIEASDRGVTRAIKLDQVGCKLFRIYSPEGGTEIIDTAEKLRKVFQGDKDVKIIGGQVMDVNTAQRAERAGCDAIMIGVAGGSQCTTSVNADIPVNTPNLLHELRGRVSVPVGVEGGGVGTHIITAFTLGASFLSKPGEIGVSWEGMGGEYAFVDPEGNYHMPYGGEASVSAKWWKDSMDDAGRLKFVEGETGVRKVGPDQMSQTGNINKLRHQLSIGLVFQRVGSIADLHAKSADNIVQVTDQASAKSVAYGVS